MDGTGRLFEPLLLFLPPSLVATVVAYPTDRPCGYAELFPLVEAAMPEGQEFVILGESFSGPLALLLAARHPPGLRGIILCATFARSPLPFFARQFRGLIRPWWFRVVPKWLIRRELLGRFDQPAVAHMVEAAIGEVRPAVLAARARAILEVDVSAVASLSSSATVPCSGRGSSGVSTESRPHPASPAASRSNDFGGAAPSDPGCPGGGGARDPSVCGGL